MPRKESQADELLTTEETARKLRMTCQRLYQLRHAGVGPRAIKVGRKLLYRASEVESWLDSQTEKVPGGIAG